MDLRQYRGKTFSHGYLTMQTMKTLMVVLTGSVMFIRVF